MADEQRVALKYPFRISGGSVVSTWNQSEIIGSRVAFCLGTWLGERVMRPNWGITFLNASHAMSGDLKTILSEALKEAFGNWFKDYEIRGLVINTDSLERGLVTVEVRYGKGGDTTDLTTKVGVRSPDGTEKFTNEGL